MKQCTKCKLTLEEDNFKKDSTKKDGLYSSCKDCCRIAGIEYCKRYKDILRRKKARRYRENRDKVKEYRKTPKGREVHRLSSAKYARTHRAKMNAGLKVYRALKAGTMVRLPCQRKNCKFKYKQAEAHHYNGYGRPYDVIFLCPRHHALADKRKRSADALRQPNNNII